MSRSLSFVCISSSFFFLSAEFLSCFQLTCSSSSIPHPHVMIQSLFLFSFSPFFVEYFDVNVTPDKRLVFLHHEDSLLVLLQVGSLQFLILSMLNRIVFIGRRKQFTISLSLSLSLPFFVMTNDRRNCIVS